MAIAMRPAEFPAILHKNNGLQLSRPCVKIRLATRATPLQNLLVHGGKAFLSRARLRVTTVMPNGSLKPELATSDEKNAAIVSPGVGSHSPSTVSTRGDMVPYCEAKALSQTLPAIFPSFFSAMERTQDVVMITSAEGIDEPGGPKLVYVNLAFEKLTGYSFEEAVGRSALFLQGPNTDAHARARLRAALESGQPAREELINYRKDGSEFWVELSIDPIEDENGVCTHWVSVQRDTTQRNLLRDRLAAQDRDLVEAQRIAELGTWSWDCQTDTVTWSRQIYKIFDIDPAETAPDYEAVQARYSPASRVVHDAAVRRCVKDGTPYELDLQIVDLDGATRWILARGEVESYRDGKPSRLRGTVQDITGRKHLEEEVRQSRDKLAWVLSTITDGLLMIDRDWRYTYVNEQAGQVLGVNPDNLLGQRVWDIFPAAKTDGVLEGVQPRHRDWHARPLRRVLPGTAESLARVPLLPLRCGFIGLLS